MAMSDLSGSFQWDEETLRRRINREREKSGKKPFKKGKIKVYKATSSHFDALEDMLAARSYPDLEAVVLSYLRNMDPLLLICGNPFADWQRQATMFLKLGKPIESYVMETAVMVKQELTASPTEGG